MEAGRQMRLLLWKDYLTRKRNLVTVCGVVWAVVCLLCVYTVRLNIDNQNFPTCQFAARALPSAGLVTFLQSFICNINNDCNPLDSYEEIPTYENAKFTQLQRQFSPLLNNDTVMSAAATVPDALKLLGTLADVADEPTFMHIAKNGLRVHELFLNPKRVKRYLSSSMDISEDVADSVMEAELSLQGILRGNINRCSVESLEETLKVDNAEHMTIFVEKLCSLSDKRAQRILIDIIKEINYNKFIKMIGDMYSKLSGDERISQLGNMITAVMRMTNINSFIPPEFLSLFQGITTEFSYLDVNIITKVMDLFGPTFGKSESYKTLREITDAAVGAVQFMNNYMVKNTNDNNKNGLPALALTLNDNKNVRNIINEVNDAVQVLGNVTAADTTFDVFHILSRLTNLIFKWLPNSVKHDFLLYSTLLAKLMEGAHQVITINMHIEEVTYNISLKNPEGVKILMKLPPHIIRKGLEALTDAERTQTMTSKINTPDAMFCDEGRIQYFFQSSKEESKSLKTKLCTSAWKKYVFDLVSAFGIYQVKDNINSMAGILIQETFGKVKDDQFYTIDYDFKVLKNFTHALLTKNAETKVDWKKVFNVDEKSNFMRVIREKRHLGKQILITVHGALAKEVIKSNYLLELKISPMMRHMTILVSAVNEQLATSNMDLVATTKKLYPQILKTLLLTALNKEKSYKSLSSHSEDIFCHGVENALLYVTLPPQSDQELLTTTLCNVSMEIERGLTNKSAIAQAISDISNPDNSINDIDWNKLITGLKELYIKLEKDYTYLFDFANYGMDEDTRQNVQELLTQVEKFWLSSAHKERILHLGIKIVFRILDILDRDVFNITDPSWRHVKYFVNFMNSPLTISDEFITLTAASLRNETTSSSLPPRITNSLRNLIPNIPNALVDAVNILINGTMDTEPVTAILNGSPPWPCANSSLADILPLSTRTKVAVRALETLFCLDENLQQEWAEYLNHYNGRDSFNFNNANSTMYPPHLFLKLSSVFDSLLGDAANLLQALKTTFDETSADISSEHVSFGTAWIYALNELNTPEMHNIIRKFLTKVDDVINSMDVSPEYGSMPLSGLWEQYTQCVTAPLIDTGCKDVGRAAWTYSFKFAPTALGVMLDNITTYFKELNEPDTTILQVAGFTKNTTLYSLYERLPDYIMALVNSYFDYGFMTKIRRAAQSEFWDCEELVNAIVPPPGNAIDLNDIVRVRPYLCPSLLHWLALPTGENTLLDVIARPQYFLFTMKSSILNSNYEYAFEKSIELFNFLNSTVDKDRTASDDDDDDEDDNGSDATVTTQEKYLNMLKSFVSLKLNDSDTSYKRFYDINKKVIAANVYLARTVAMTNKLAESINNFNATAVFEEMSDEFNKAKDELINVQKIYKRRPSDVIAMHFDVFTDMLWENKNKLSDSIDAMCNNLKNNITRKNIIVENQKIKRIICALNYKPIYEAVQDILAEEYGKARISLQNLVNVLKDGEYSNTSDIFDFFSKRQQLMASLKLSIQYASDLGLPIYLKYLQINIEHYNVIMALLAGQDWWKEVTQLYNGPKVSEMLKYLEQNFDIAEDTISNLDKVYLVRFLHDINWKTSDAFCLSNITMSDYFPDQTGILTKMKQDMLCMEEKTKIFREIPPLLIASQGYDSELDISKEVNYTLLEHDISNVESKFKLVMEGPKPPVRPKWISEDKDEQLKKIIFKLLNKEVSTKFYFGIIVNVIDAATLYINNSECTVCSELTSWVKQLNLQVFKKQDYDTLLCRLQDMGLHEIYLTLRNDFHWDMAIKELISTRNYTNMELNKSLRDFLEQVKLHILEDLDANSTKLSECLAHNVTKNEFGHFTLFANTLANTLKLFRAQLPHLQDIVGIADTPFMKQLSSDVSSTLDIEKPIRDYLDKNNTFDKDLGSVINDADFLLDVKNAQVNLREVNLGLQSKSKYIKLQKYNWNDMCKTYNCSKINEIIDNSLNKSLLANDLLKLQIEEFWKFNFLSRYSLHIEELLRHVARITGVASKIELQGLMDGQLESVLDFLIQILADDTLNTIVYSINGLTKELYPLLQDTDLEFDLDALSKGLITFYDFKTYLLDQSDSKVEISKLFPDPNSVEVSLNNLGINHTNFWSIAAPRIRAGYIQLKPIFSSNEENYHIKDFVCKPENMSKVLIPGNLDVVTLDDVYGAVIEQFCEISDEKAKQIIPALIQNLNFNFVFEKVSNVFLSKLYSASNLTEAEGKNFIDNLPEMASLLPVIQKNVGSISDAFKKEPLFQGLTDFSSLGSMLSSSKFLSSAGNMMCGKPFDGQGNRFYKAIAETKDFSNEPDPAQLEVLPTDFCRSLYKDVLKLSGGKIVWSFVKPLVMGKVLYTPATPAVRRIIEKANSTFAPMFKLTNMLHSLASSFSSVDKLTQHRDGVAVLQNLMNSPSFSDVRTMLFGDAEFPDLDIDGIFNEFGDLQDMGALLRKTSNLLRCVNLDRFHAMPDEQRLSYEAVKLTRVNEFSAGLVFTDVKVKGDVPIKVDYKIRMDIESVPTTFWKKAYFWIPGPESNFLENMRYFRGFIQLQDIIDRAIIDLSLNQTRSVQKREIGLEKDFNWAVYTQQTPYPCYQKDFFQTSLYESCALIVAFYFSMLFTVASVVRFIVIDKESGNTMLMSVMGVNLNYHTFSWFITSAAEIIITMVAITLVLSAGHILPRSDVSFIFVWLMVYGFSVLMFCYMMSKLFKSASLAAVCSGIAYLITFLPYVIMLAVGSVISFVSKILVCLPMSSAFCHSLLLVGRYEAMGRGTTWGDLWYAPDRDHMSLGLVMIIMLIDGLLYFVIGALIERFFGLKTLKNNITYCESKGEKAGVSIVNVTKIYGERSRKPKVALDNVSVELHKGQITTLLGHNGAGKTTLIKIITGMLRPTKGHIVMHSDEGEGAQLGVCPQRDVLYEYMTAREHVAFYAQLKGGLPRDQRADEIQSMLRMLSLSTLADEPVCRLSGGTRRRLCVALAFVGQPQLVSLDEPTTGVDPAARREIWSLIMKLKEDRTVLLTTHHFDEAELLSDQIVIVHKGRIHTTGSPIDIKRTLGSGYKLTAMYPDSRFDSYEDDEDDLSIEERTKQLLAVVRDVVKNAQLLDVNGSEVEISLPFFDVSGSNSNYLALCTTLEARQTELGYKTYTLDCSSLEQVFANICRQADGQPEYGTNGSSNNSITDFPSKSNSSTSVRTTDNVPLVPSDGPLKGTHWAQFCAILYARYLHYTRNRWLLFMLIALPSLFVAIAMGFSIIRPTAEVEIPLRLHPEIYGDITDFIVTKPSITPNDQDASLAQGVMDYLKVEKGPYKNWTDTDTLTCKCTETTQDCDYNDTYIENEPKMMALPDVATLNQWLLTTNEPYIDKRFGGFSSSVKNNLTNLVAWYNNKGFHAMPSYLNALNNAIMRMVSKNDDANITTYSHPLKISNEQLNKATFMQHAADVGISYTLTVAYCLVTAGAAIYLVRTRRSQEKRLQLLCGVSPALYWFSTLVWDIFIILINMLITVCLLEAFGFSVFVAHNNLPAICLLILLIGYAGGSFTYIIEKIFTDDSMANMVIFSINVFIAFIGNAALLVLDIISDSDATDHARWILHKVLLILPQFAFADAILEIAKNTVQAEVLSRFGMDTYKDPVTSNLILYHYVSLISVGTLLMFLNLVIEYDCFQFIVDRFRKVSITEAQCGEVEAAEVTAERKRVQAAVTYADTALRLQTIGNINAGFLYSEVKRNSITRMAGPARDTAQCVALGKAYRARAAVRGLTLGVLSGQCTALLGQNGAGKSTTFAMLTGEIRPTVGKIYLDQKRVNARKLCNGLISYCPQSDAIDPLMTVRETLLYYCRLRGIADREEGL